MGKAGQTDLSFVRGGVENVSRRKLRRGPRASGRGACWEHLSLSVWTFFYRVRDFSTAAVEVKTEEAIFRSIPLVVPNNAARLFLPLKRGEWWRNGRVGGF